MLDKVAAQSEKCGLEDISQKAKVALSTSHHNESVKRKRSGQTVSIPVPLGVIPICIAYRKHIARRPSVFT